MSDLRILYHPKVVGEDIPRLDPPIRVRIKNAIEQKLSEAPEQFAKPLAYTKAGVWSLRIGTWRVLFTLRRDVVWILKIGHRRDVYRGTERAVPGD